MKAKNLKLLSLLAAFLVVPSFAWAAPNITSTDQRIISNGQSIIIAGSNFGTKTTADPKYFNNLENETIGQLPHDQITNMQARGTTQANLAHDGSKSLEWDYCAEGKIFSWNSTAIFYVGEKVSYNSNIYDVFATVGPSAATPDLDSTHFSFYAAYANWSSSGSYTTGQIVYSGSEMYLVTANVGPSGLGPNQDPAHFTPTLPGSHCPNGKGQTNDWERNAIDLGAAGADRIYVSAWVYLDKGSSTSQYMDWQWKGFPTITSSGNLYYDLPSTYPSTCSGSTAWQSTAAFTGYWYFSNTRWGNASNDLYYYDTNLCKNITGVTATNLPSDAVLWNQWQRLEFYAQRSSAAGVADGIWRGQRIGKAAYNFNYTNAITNQAGNDPWRYVVLSHALESVGDGYVNLHIYMDDIYVDTSQSRVEICDSSTWSTRSHCEIQIPQTTWIDGQLQIKVNQGSFLNNSPQYLYVIDASGSTNASGYPITFGSGALDTTAPSAPSGLVVQ